MLNVLKVSLNEIDDLVSGEGSFLGTDWGVMLNSFEELIIDEFFGFLPPELISVLFTDVFSRISKEVE